MDLRRIIKNALIASCVLAAQALLTARVVDGVETIDIEPTSTFQMSETCSKTLEPCLMTTVVSITPTIMSTTSSPLVSETEPITTVKETETSEQATETAALTETPSRYYDVPFATEYQDYILEEIQGTDLSLSLVLAIIHQESGFQVDAIGGCNYGLMQVNQINSDDLYNELGITDLMDPYQNMKAGIHIISNLLNEYNDVQLALMAYNNGEGGAAELWNQGVYSTEYSQDILSYQDSLEEQ